NLVGRMRRSGGGRQSLAHRVKNDASTSSGRTSTGSRSSTGSRQSLGSSIGNRQSLGASRQNVRKSMIPKLGGPSSIVSAIAPMAKKRRSSGYGKTYGHRDTILKDPRPITDKGYKHRMIEKLIAFLVDNKFPHPITPKVLQSPTSKDFLRIFEFIYGFIHPNFHLTQKPEEEVPKLMKELRYPFIISKSALFAIGSPHSWPSLLAALVWLVDLVKYAFNVAPEELMFPSTDFESGPAEESLVFKYLEQSYSDYMQGADTFEELEDDLKIKFSQMSCGLNGGLDQLAQENRRLAEELSALQNEPDKLQQVKSQFEVTVNDEGKFKDYLTNLEHHKHRHDQTLAGLEDEHQTLMAEFNTVIESCKRMQEIFDTQEFSPADVERMNHGAQELQRQIDLTEHEVEGLDKQIWDEEIQIGKSQQRIEAKCAEYNKVATMLKLIPSSAENAHGRDYELRQNFGSTASSIDFIGTIKPALLQMRKQCAEKVYEAKSRLITETEALEQVTDMTKDKKEEIASMEISLKKLENELEYNKEAYLREYHKYQEEVESVQSQIAELRKSSQQSVEECRNDLRSTQKKVERNLAEMKRREHELMSFMWWAVESIVGHLSQIPDESTKLKVMVGRELHLAKQQLETAKTESSKLQEKI
ncbi:unnamed protein product, partial [Owenia fusiformis]